MSIKTFHVFFVVISTMFTLGLGGWAVREYRRVDGLENIILAAVGFICTAALLIYGRWFLQKVKGIEP